MNLISPPPDRSTGRVSRIAALGDWSLGARRTLPLKSGSGAASMATLRAAVEACTLSDGAAIGFHHHFRNGDRTIAAVMAALADTGLRNLTLVASSLFPVHEKLLPYVRAGTIGRIVTDYMRGPLADAVIGRELAELAVFQSHGGRARAISSGEIVLDAAFVGVPLAHVSGAATGRGGRIACGPLGYAMVDAAYARKTVVLADEVSEEMPAQVDIPATQVDLLVPFADPGDPAGILSGSTRPLDTPVAQHIADMVVRVIEAAGLIQPGFSFQTGAGGYSLAAVPAIGRSLAQAGLAADFVSGGITAAHVEMLKQGLVRRVRDVQSFDLEAVRSSITHPDHHAMSAADYASPDNPDAAVNGLSVMLLGAGEVDLDFNVNVAVGGDGRLIGGPGGHPDAAEGASLSIVTTTLTGSGFAKIVDAAACVTTQGTHIDVVVTDRGIAVNPLRPDLAEDLRRAGLPVGSIGALRARAAAEAFSTRRILDGRPIAVVENRRGGPLDVILSA
jgi:citrate lyase subunit alpha/citrate CoA-transferase